MMLKKIDTVKDRQCQNPKMSNLELKSKTGYQRFQLNFRNYQKVTDYKRIKQENLKLAERIQYQYIFYY